MHSSQTHTFGIRNDNPHVRNHIERSFDWFFKTLPEDVEYIIHLGDLFDRRKYINYVIAASCRKSFLEPVNEKYSTWVIAGNHDCLDEATECLTKRGWKKYYELLDDDQVLSKNNINQCEWSFINNKILKWYDGDLISLQSRDINMLMTPKHRVPLLRVQGQYTESKYFLAENLPSMRHWAVSSSSYSTNIEHPISDDMLRLLGWVLTDGNFHKDRITIYQSKSEGCEKIRSLLKRLKFPYTESVRQRNITEVCGRMLKKQPLPEYSWRISTECSRKIQKLIPNKQIPAWMYDLSTRQFSILLAAIVDGDGSWDGKYPENYQCAVVYGKEIFLDNLQSLAVQHGWRAKVTQDNRGHSVLRMSKTPKTIISTKPTYKPYKGWVWCLSVPHTNFMVRRNGCAYFTGNCYHTNTLEINSLTEIVDGKYSNISVVLQPKEINIDGTNILLLPWINESNQTAAFEAIKNTKASILMAHLELNGFEMHKGSVMDHGMDIPDLNRFDAVYSGHYHHKSTRGNIHYLGAFCDYHWSDYADPRGYHILDTQTRELTFFENTNSIHRMVIYNDKASDIDELLNNTDFSQYGNTFVQVVCANRSNPYTWDQFMDRITKAGPLDVSIVQDIESFKDNDALGLVNEAEDTLTILDQYISGLTLPVDSNRMKKYMRELYTEAISVEHVE